MFNKFYAMNLLSNIERIFIIYPLFTFPILGVIRYWWIIGKYSKLLNSLFLIFTINHCRSTEASIWWRWRWLCFALPFYLVSFAASWETVSVISRTMIWHRWSFLGLTARSTLHHSLPRSFLPLLLQAPPFSFFFFFPTRSYWHGLGWRGDVGTSLASINLSRRNRFLPTFRHLLMVRGVPHRWISATPEVRLDWWLRRICPEE